MNIKYVAYFFIFFNILSLPAHAITASIYKWVDENNQVHFSQTPPQPEDNKNIKVEVINEGTKIAPPKPNAAEAGNDAQNDQNAQSNGQNSLFADDDNVDPELKAAEAKGKEKMREIKQQCQAKRNHLKTMLANPLVSINQDGDEKLLTESQRQERMAQLKTELKEVCEGR